MTKIPRHATPMQRTLLASLVLLAPAALGQTAKEGTVESINCWGGPVHVMTPSANERFGTYTVTGGSQSANKLFDAMSIECVGVFENRPAGWQHKGYCVSQDASGDKTYLADTVTPQGGYTWEYLGGTGKFQGITGGGKVERLGNISPVRAGTLQGCRRILGTYKLP